MATKAARPIKLKPRLRASKSRKTRDAEATAAATAAVRVSLTLGQPSYEAARVLHEHGVLVCRISELVDPAWWSAWRTQCEEAVRSFPEFKEHPSFSDLRREYTDGGTRRYCVGGTSFLGNPSVFHHPTFRKLRSILTAALLDTVFTPFRALFLADKPYKLECLVERIMARVAGDLPAAESWHVDTSPSRRLGDVIFGGFLVLDPEPQMFSCIKGTHPKHSSAPDHRPGFQVFSAEQQASFSARRCPISVAPGEIVLFYQDIVHEVLGNRAAARPFTSVRQFVGFRLTESDDPLHPLDETLRRIADQDVMRIKSDQLPPLYPRAYTMYSKHRTNLDRFLRDMTEDDAVNTHVNVRNFWSLRTLSEKWRKNVMYPAYEPHELELLRPRTTHWVHYPTADPFVTELRAARL